MSQFTSGEASKFLIAVFTAVAAGLPVFFGSATWEPFVLSVIGAILIYLVPNKQ